MNRGSNGNRRNKRYNIQFTGVYSVYCIGVPMETDVTWDIIYCLQGYIEIQDTVYRGSNGNRCNMGYNILITGVLKDTGYSV